MKMVHPLSPVQVERTKPGLKTITLFDGGGLYLEILPSGTRGWRLKYRFAGKPGLLSLGPFPLVSLAAARAERDKIKRMILEGINPSAARKARKAAQEESGANTFEVIFREWYAEFSPGMAKSHTSKILARFQNDLLPWMGKRPIAEITPPEVLAVVKRIAHRGAVDTCHRALWDCGRVFRYAVRTGRANADPTRDLRGRGSDAALPPAVSGHFAAVLDPKRLGEVLNSFDDYRGGFAVSSALRLQPLLFVRPGDLRHMEWKDVDLEAAEWRFTTNKKKGPLIVPLSRQALAILRELHPLTGRGRYAFPGGRTPDGSRPMSENGVLMAIRTLGITKEELTAHGFRATARTLLDEVLGFRVDFIEAQQAHSVKDPNGRAYNRTTFLEDRKAMMQIWADYLDQLKKGQITPNFPPSRTDLGQWQALLSLQASKSGCRQASNPHQADPSCSVPNSPEDCLGAPQEDCQGQKGPQLGLPKIGIPPGREPGGVG